MTKHRSPCSRRRLFVESLESRQLLATGDLDVTFSGDGLATPNIGNPYNAADVVIQRDGKIVLLGSLNPEGGQDQFLLTRYNPGGSLDTTFSDDGVVIARFGQIHSSGRAVALQDDGKIVVFGNIGDDLGLARYLSDGRLDSTFGSGGRVVTAFGVNTEASDLLVQRDGKIVAAGQTNESDSDDNRFVLARYNADGSLDTSFDDDGKLSTQFASGGVDAPRLALQGDGKIVAAGRSFSYTGIAVSLARYESNGSLDPTFGDGGTVGITSNFIFSGTGIGVQSTGRIIVGGSIPLPGNSSPPLSDFGVLALRPDGSIDTSFGENGRAASPLGEYQGFARDLAIKPDDGIVAVGDAGAQYGHRRFVVAAYKADGSSDRSFTGDGSVVANVEEYGWSIAVQTDGKYVVAGWSFSGLRIARVISNVQPRVSLGGSTTFTEGDPASVLASGAAVSDADDVVLTGGNLNVAITSNAASGDRLRIRNQGTGAGQIGVTSDRFVRYAGVVIGRFSGGIAGEPLVVTLNASATITAVQALVRSVTYKNFDASPPTELRTVRFLLHDGDGGTSRAQVKYVNVQRLSDSPRITMGGEASYREDSPAVVVSSFAGLESADSLNFDSGKLTVAIAKNAAASDRLSLRNQGTGGGQIGLSASDVTFGGTSIGTVTGGVGATPLEVALNANASPAAVLALIRNVTFATLGDAPHTALRMLSFVLGDGDGHVSPPVFKPAKVLAVNDAAVLTADAGPVGYVNNDPAGVLLAATATVADPDNLNFYLGRLNVAVVDGAAAVNRLEIGGAFTVSGAKVMLGSTVIAWIHSRGIGLESLSVTFTDQATRSIVQQLVRSVRFRSINAANTFDRTIEFTVFDSPSGIGSTAEVQVAVRDS